MGSPLGHRSLSAEPPSLESLSGEARGALETLRGRPRVPVSALATDVETTEGRSPCPPLGEGPRLKKLQCVLIESQCSH